MTAKDQIVIRPAMSSDSEACAALLGELGYPAPSEFVCDKLKRLTGRESDRVFVAVDGGKVVGFVSCHIMPLIHRAENLCRVTALVVAAGHRRRNIGRRLMQGVEACARDSGCGRVEITSGEMRQGAHIFYEHIGYHEASRRFLKRLGNKQT